MASADEGAVRVWCEALAGALHREVIGRIGDPYLERYFVAGYTPEDRKHPGGIYLHHFVRSDIEEEVHSHPWHWATSLILVGGYREQRCNAAGELTVRLYRPGDVNQLGPDDRHRVDLLGEDCWTLFTFGSYAKPWGFSPLC